MPKARPSLSETARKREWRCYVRDMVGFCERVQEDTQGLDRDSFVSDRRTYDAVRLNLILLGEAAGNVPEAVRTMHPAIPWRTIVATRNQLIHGYPGVDDGIVWGIVKAELPALKPALKKVLETPQQNE